MIIEDISSGLNLKSFLKIKESNIHANESYFSNKINNLKELYHILLRYSIPFFKNDDLLYSQKFNFKREKIIFENNNSIISLFDGILSLTSEANYLAVKVLQRSIFEFLIVNNHLVLTKDLKYIEKWMKGEDVKIVKNILYRTNNYKYRKLFNFWAHLSNQNHASSKTTQSEFDWAANFGHYVDSMFVTYLLLYFYNYQLRELYFPFMQSVYLKNGTSIKVPFKSDWFKKKDKIKELEKSNNNDELYSLVEAFTFKWELK